MHLALPLALIAGLGVGTLAKHIAVPEHTPHLNLKIEQNIALERLNHTTASGSSPSSIRQRSCPSHASSTPMSYWSVLE